MKNITRSLLGFLLLLCACGPEGPPPGYSPEPAPTQKRRVAINYEVVRTYPHDPTAFTEGLFFYDGKLYESTGAPEHLPKARSTFGVIDTATGKLNVKVEVDKKLYFGEGLAAANNKLYWLTYTNQVCFVYDDKTYKRVGQFSYPNEQGWGLININGQLVMSDGTYNLTYYDPETFKPLKILPVTKDGYALDHINELEFINGYIYANVWMTNQIVKIDPSTGAVVGELDLSEIWERVRKKDENVSEMNGIAYDPGSNRVFVTGKMWPEMYEIRFAW
jgi:glutamine cyclotransferase